MKTLLKIAGALAVATALTVPTMAQTTIVAPGQSTTGTYMDYMKTVYARATFAEVLQVPIATFDKDFKLTPMAAESWSQSEDGLTWTFKLRPGLVWSDGEPLTAEDYVFALTRAATSGYDFAWYWDFAGGIKNWKEVTEGTADVSTLGLKAVDDLTIEVTTNAPKPYLPSVTSLWYPVPKHVVDELGDDWALNVDTVVTSGPFDLESWEKSNNSVVLTKSDTYTGPWQAQIDRLEIDPTLGAPEVGLPAFLAGDADYSFLNTGQVPVAEQRYPDGIRKNAVFATSYISFDMDSEPFNNVDVRKAFYYAVDRAELTSTVLKDIAIPAGSILPPGYPGYNEEVAAEAVFDPEQAAEHMAAAGFPGGDGFPEIEIWYREEGGYNGAIIPAMAQYLQAEFKEVLGVTMNIRVLPGQDWMQGLLNKENNIFIAPYEYDYLDPSNFYGIFYNGGRHSHHVDAYDKLVAEADSNPVWEERLDLYAQAEQVLIDNASIVPLVHPITIAVISDELGGDAATPNELGFTPLDRLAHYFFTHLTKQ
ncbi:peptide ABC transporter substrate-binding protein [Devosia sp. J2-20]|jgi:oligopeptide transport system substrate-binding protein|uniref:Peptide ABC transporter substrate-binding protein n=1 Tax=Devosia litorisediminis TaxID=2829817 RepID=A0A942E8Y0_9HYPH|nr:MULTISPECIES: peptide ABC transporter substrate-binding protein [Devosia]MBS3847722.1 peptide ABC transporter substrate-binding protein [Devosia litorisediminis]MCZ4345696.1 peptide ABC transporter substrate-binding protein [Devosia neptuniae]WDQ99159.1 peptide ABC transporter substrate-binding protein [Devosia sp. J2-20]|tara:strand:- start:34287 stop:35891 length:1605 start_codon:yes stop_codon:yes gene_type:complete